MSTEREQSSWSELVAAGIDHGANLLVPPSLPIARHRYRVAIEDTGGAETIALRMVDSAPPCRAGDRVELEVTTVEALYLAECEILAAPISRAGSVEDPILSLRPIGKAHRRQRRALFRVPIDFPLRYMPIIDATLLGPASLAIERAGWPAQMIDLSGGGAQLRVQRSHDEGNVLMLQVQAPGLRLLEPITVVRSERTFAGKRQQHLLGCRFVQIANRKREQLIQWLFREAIARRCRDG